MNRWLPLNAVSAVMLAASASAQGLKLDVKRAGERPDRDEETREMYLKFDLTNISKEPQKNLLVLWTLAVDHGKKEGGVKYYDGLKIVSLLPGDTTSFKSKTIEVSARGLKPSWEGYAVRIQSENQVIFSKIDPPHLAKQIEEYEKLKATPRKY